MTAFIVTGTDTDVGKTLVAAMLVLALDGIYWKPVQSGTADGTDTGIVRRLTGLDESRFRPERYVLSEPLSPHRAAELDGIEIDVARLEALPETPAERPLIIEGAGGVLVPITRATLQVDLFPLWAAPAVVCARTRLGTINHTLLTVEALRGRAVPILGIVFVGDAMPDTERTITDFAGVPRLGRLPWLSQPDRVSLAQAFRDHFDRGDFLGSAP